MKILIGKNCKLTLDDIQKLNSAPEIFLEISSASLPPMRDSYQFLKNCIDNRMPIYGITTSFGDQVNLIDEEIDNENQDAYQQSIIARQRNIIKSLACGLGNIVDPQIIRLTMMLRAHCLSQGYSGVSHASVSALVNFINSGVTPVVRTYGSIGASGDLIPLATISAALIGENVDVFYQNQIITAPEALECTNLEKFTPELRDGLALINGTCFMTAIAGVALQQLQRLFRQMLSAIAMALESMLVIDSAYQTIVHQLKHHKGQIEISQFMTDFWQDSQLISNLDELRQDPTSRPVQDYYSLRAVPQGFGTFQENLRTSIQWIEDEMNSVNDNPIIDVATQKIHHNANFMGYYVTDACDLLKMDIAQASSWIHALLANLVHARKSHGLPTNLVENPGKNNGFRSIQLLAAALAVQNRKLAQVQQAFMLPTEGDNQDVNSLGTHAAFDFQEAVTNLERLTALLLLAASQALELRDINKAGTCSQKIYATIRECSPSLIDCRPMTEEIEAIIDLLQNNNI